MTLATVFTTLPPHPVTISIIGLVIGFLSGLLGKGGSAITTPALQIFAGAPPLSALASPLPATLPATLSASLAYFKHSVIHRHVAIWSIAIGIPATLAGSYFSDWVSGRSLMLLTAVFVLGLGLSFVASGGAKDHTRESNVNFFYLAIIALGVGFLSGLLANSGGVLYAPLFIRVLRLPTKQALATSLIVAAGLSIPGTIVHWQLGHIDWRIVLLLSVANIPGAWFGAKLALSLRNEVLERIFGVMLILFGAFDILYTW